MSPAAEAELVVETGSRRQAEILAEALAPDSEGFLDVAVDGDRLVLVAASGSVLGLSRTLDDALTAIGAVEGVGGVGDAE